MRTRLTRLLSISMVLGVLTLPAWADRLSGSITLDQPETVAGKVLPKGDYKAVFDTDSQKLDIKQGKRIVAEVPARWQPTDYKVPETAVVLQSGRIKQIEFEGKKGIVNIPR